MTKTYCCYGMYADVGHSADCHTLKAGPDYGVPTGVVPRVEYQPPLRRNAKARAAVLGPDPVQRAVDNYLLMERKARAWDGLRKDFKANLKGMTYLGEPLEEYLDRLFNQTP